MRKGTTGGPSWHAGSVFHFFCPGFAQLEPHRIVLEDLKSYRVHSARCLCTDDTVEEQNPFRTTLKPWLKPLFVDMYGGNHLAGFLGWCRVSSIHSMIGQLTPPPQKKKNEKEHPGMCFLLLPCGKTQPSLHLDACTLDKRRPSNSAPIHVNPGRKSQPIQEDDQFRAS